MPHPPPSRTSLLAGTTASMWLVWVVDFVVPGPIGHGIVPRTAYGLSGIVMAPFLHANLQHLVANTIPFVLLGAVILLRGAGAFTVVMLTSAAISGLGDVALRDAEHASHRRERRRVRILRVSAVVVAVVYGAAFLTSLIPAYGISWAGHVFGFIGGATSARLRA